MICPRCGKNIPNGSMFCDGCGASLTNQQAAPQYPPVAPVYPPTPAPYTPNPYAAPVQAPVVKTPTDEFISRANLCFIFSIVGLVLSFSNVISILFLFLLSISSLVFLILSLALRKKESTIGIYPTDPIILANIEAAKKKLKTTKILAIVGFCVWFGSLLIYGLIALLSLFLPFLAVGLDELF